MLSDESEATPATAGTTPPPLSVPPPGFAPSAIVRGPVKLVAVLPTLSRAVTCTAGVITAPAVVAVGCTVNTRTLAGAGVMLKAALVAPATPVAVAVSP